MKIFIFLAKIQHDKINIHLGKINKIQPRSTKIHQDYKESTDINQNQLDQRK